MIRAIIFSIAAFTVVGLDAVEPQPCLNGACGQTVIQIGIPQQVYIPPAPPVVYRPVTTYQPLQYQGSVIGERRYATPIRDSLFGRWFGFHYYR